MFASSVGKLAHLVAFLSLLVRCRSEYVPGKINGEVVILDTKSFPEAIKDPSNPLWLLKFYAPWCGHCKKIAPVLEKASLQVKGQMAIGKIDCTTEKGLCNEYKVRGYPTLKYSIDGEIDDYPLGRDQASIVKFARKMSAPPLQIVASYEEAMEYATAKAEDGVIFLGYDPTNKPDEVPSGFYQVFSKVARRKQASGHFLWLEPSDPESIKTPAIVKRIEPDVKVRFLENVESLTAEALAEWFTEQSLPLVNMLGPDNFQKVSKMGRPLAIAVADTEDTEQVKALKEHMLKYITSSENDKYYYGIMDGKKFIRFLGQFNVGEEHIPQFLVLDGPTKTFWQNETYSNLFEFIKAIDDGEIQSETASRTSRKGVLGKLEHYFISYFPYSLVALLLTVFGFVWMLVPAFEEDPYSQSALEEMMEEMEGTNQPEGDEGEETKKKK
ncbi:unnamed protein product [Cylindrotheca closterium]|uniref:Thioredoxin domain-containing protein n=1 Tax=Cylindrotheca closterium TaxID=2856 RepID=A0AAD2FV98_9STRA|nr:unnamed protein product [Cylindrotheca closterium]